MKAVDHAWSPNDAACRRGLLADKPAVAVPLLREGERWWTEFRADRDVGSEHRIQRLLGEQLLRVESLIPAGEVIHGGVQPPRGKADGEIGLVGNGTLPLRVPCSQVRDVRILLGKARVGHVQ